MTPSLDMPVTCRSGRGAQRTLRLADALDAARIEQAHVAANAWIKALRHVRVDGTSMRDRFTCRGDSLWWFTEIYLHKRGQALAWHLAAAAWRALIAREQPAAVQLAAAAPALALVGREIARQTGVAWDGPRTLPPAWRRTLAMRTRARYLMWSALASPHRGRDRDRPTLPPGSVLAFVHSAFWRRADGGDDGDEQYVGAILREIEAQTGRSRLALVGLGPPTNFRARRWWHPVIEPAPGGRVVPIERLTTRADLREAVAVWRRRERHLASLLASADLRAAAVIDGCDLWPLVADELEGVTWLQWPWSVRAMDEAAAVLDRLSPSVVLTYAEAGGWGRAIVLEARRRGIASAGIQHGFIYRHWLNYLHEEDEFRPSPANPADVGVPAPTRTLVFDGFAREHLLVAGHFPADRLVVTGSPARDALVTRVSAMTETDRAATRDRLGLARAHHVVLVVTKHAQMRRAFPALVRAVEAVPSARLVVKCHPAETPDPYQRDAAGSPVVTVAPAAEDLAALLAVASVIVTVNSTVAIDAMALGLPSLVVELPNNLSPLVDAGVMVGAPSLDDIGPLLRRLLEEGPLRAELARRQRAWLERFGGPAAGAAPRAARAVLDLRAAASRSPAVDDDPSAGPAGGPSC